MPDADPHILRRLDSQELAVLATVDAGQPYCSLIVFALNNDAKQILFFTNRNSRKFINLQKNPKVGILIDDRPQPTQSFSDSIALNVFGEATEALGDDRQTLIAQFLTKHPRLKNFVDLPDEALIKVMISEIKCNSFSGS